MWFYVFWAGSISRRNTHAVRCDCAYAGSLVRVAYRPTRRTGFPDARGDNTVNGKERIGLYISIGLVNNTLGNSCTL